ncbi:MAG TPA: hypothetical protein VGR30_04895 [Candidatus Binatia bacterium]|jgi:hypothetical protein|nr:hypothetical protein [Candidatus Binatia bacterium]
MEIFIKVAPPHFDRLRSRIPVESPAYEAIAKATRIDHSFEGVFFKGYTIPCDQNQARIILEIARQCCPEIIPTIEQAMRLARPRR